MEEEKYVYTVYLDKQKTEKEEVLTGGDSVTLNKIVVNGEAAFAMSDKFIFDTNYVMTISEVVDHIKGTQGVTVVNGTFRLL